MWPGNQFTKLFARIAESPPGGFGGIAAEENP
jgi:hypothetical protein